ncbi:MAG: hypothetical protein QGG40_06090 [Myxococcota bacterium]|nr:hypothetical protein [Myxococcota bacterium]
MGLGFRLLWVACVLLGFTSGCGTENCAEKAQAAERDWCRYEQVVDSAGSERLEEALAILAVMETPMVKAAAVDKLITAAPPGLDSARAQSLCQELPQPHHRACIQTWSRPHLWGE